MRNDLLNVDDRYLDLEDLAKYSGMSVRTLRSMIPRGMPVYRPGGKILVRRSEFDVWMGRFRQAQSVDLDRVVDDVMEDVLGRSGRGSGRS